MKIVVILPKDSEKIFFSESVNQYGGATAFMVNVLTALKDTYQVYPIIPAHIGLYDLHRMKSVKKLRISERGLFLRMLKFHKKMQELKPDVIIQHGLTNESCLLSLYCRLRGIRFVFIFASDIEVKGLKQQGLKKILLFPLLLHSKSVLLTQNNYQRSYILDKYLKRSEIIRNGYLWHEIKGTERDYFLWVGRVDSNKNPLLFIELAKKNPKKKFCMVVGQIEDKKLFDRVQQEIKRINNISLKMSLDWRELTQVYSKSIALINTSGYEGFPQTFIESMIHGTPIVSLNCNPDSILDKMKVGYIAKGKFSDLNTILKTLDPLSEDWKKRSSNCQGYVRRYHSMNQMKETLMRAICPNKRPILHLIYNLNLGGAESIVRMLIDSLDIKVKTIEELGGTVITRVINLAIHIAKIKPRIIHVHLGKTLAYALIASFFGRYVLVYHEHGEVFYNRKLRWLLRFSQNRIERIIAVSETTRKELILHAGIDPSKIRVLANPLNPEIRQMSKKRKGNYLIIGYLGRLTSIKGVRTILRAIPLLDFPIKVVIGGEGEDSTELKKIVQYEKITDKVHFIGKVSNPSQFYSSIDVLIVPSRLESFGLVIIEAMHCSVPVICSDIPSLREIVIPHKNGLVFKMDESAELAKMIKHLTKTPDLTKRIIKNGKLTSQNYKLSRYCEHLQELYKEIGGL